MKKTTFNLFGNLINNIRTNPVFHISQSNRELFHSNFLAWLLETGTVEDSKIDVTNIINFFTPKGTGTKGLELYKVLREKAKLDLLLIFTTPDIIEKLKKSETALLTKDEINSFKFVVIENKFKSVPSADQLKKYSEKLQKGISVLETQKHVKAKDENTTCYILAPDFYLKALEEVPGWYKKSYEIYIEELYSTLSKSEPETKSSEDDIFIRKYLENYTVLLRDTMLLFRAAFDDYKKNNGITPSPDNLKKIKAIRLHDLYEKNYFQLVLNDLEINCDSKDTGYSHGSGFIEWFVFDKAFRFKALVQIQQGAFEIGICNFTEKGFTSKNQKKVYDFSKKCFEELKATKPYGLIFDDTINSEHKFGDYKYRTVKIDDSARFKELETTIQKTIKIIQKNIKMLNNN